MKILEIGKIVIDGGNISVDHLEVDAENEALKQSDIICLIACHLSELLFANYQKALESDTTLTEQYIHNMEI